MSENRVNGNWIGIYFYHSNNNTITENNILDNGGGISYYNSNDTIEIGNNVTNSWITDISQIDSNNIVMATNIYTCGPAALVTIMKHIGINTTEEEITTLAETDENGTKMSGLVQAAQHKGLNAIGARLTKNQLRTDYIVVLTINGYDHYDIIRNVTDEMVYLIDTNLGYIEMTSDKFNELYTGNALVILNNTNGTLSNATLLDNETMQNITAMGYVWRWKKVWIPSYSYRYRVWVDTSHYVWKKYIYFIYDPHWEGIFLKRGYYRIGYKKVLVKSGHWKTKWGFCKGHYAKYRYKAYVPWYHVNGKKAYKVISGSIKITSGTRTAAAGILGEPETFGLSTFLVIMGGTQIAAGISEISSIKDEPDYKEQPLWKQEIYGH